MSHLKNKLAQNGGNGPGSVGARFADAFNGNNYRWMQNSYQEAQQQIFDFVILRLRRTEDALKSCKTCHQPAELAPILQKWHADALKDCFDFEVRLQDKLHDTIVKASASAGGPSEAA